MYDLLIELCLIILCAHLFFKCRGLENELKERTRIYESIIQLEKDKCGQAVRNAEEWKMRHDSVKGHKDEMELEFRYLITKLKTQFHKKVEVDKITRKEIVIENFTYRNALIALQSAIRGYTERLSYLNCRRRWDVVKEVLQTEHEYLGTIKNLIYVASFWNMRCINSWKVIVQPLVMKATELMISLEDIKTMFGYIQEIYSCNTKLMQEMNKLVDKWNCESRFGALFLDNMELLKSHISYTMNFTDSSLLIDKYMQRESFIQFIEKAFARPEFQNKDLLNLMVLPMKRMAYYINTLEKLNECTRADHPDKQNLCIAAHKLKEMSGLNSNKRDTVSACFMSLDDKERRGSLEKDMKDKVPIHEGTLFKNKQETYAYLFSDFGDTFLAYSKKGQIWSLSKKLRWKKLYFDTNTRLVLPKSYSNKLKQFSFDILTPERTYKFFTNTFEEYSAWVKHLQNAIEAVKTTYH